MVLGEWTQDLVLARQALYELSYIPSSISKYLLTISVSNVMQIGHWQFMDLHLSVDHFFIASEIPNNIK